MDQDDPQNGAEHIADRASSTIDLSGRYRASAPIPTHEPHARASSSEQQIRTRGKWLIITGITTGLFTFALAIVWDTGFGHDMPLAYVLPLYGISLSTIGLGCRDYLSLPTRRIQEHCIEQLAQLRREVTQLVSLMDEELQQRFYRGVADQVRNQMFDTGTEHARPLGRTGDLLRFRQRH